MKVERIATPIGIEIAAESPEEIAVSILAEVTQTIFRKELCLIRGGGDIATGVVSDFTMLDSRLWLLSCYFH